MHHSSQTKNLKLQGSACLSRQAALLLAHYGVRCARLHMQHSLETLPGLAPACAPSADALSKALRAVEAGTAADHPKQAALKRVLLSATTLQPVRMAPLKSTRMPPWEGVPGVSCLAGLCHCMCSHPLPPRIRS